MLIPPHSGYHHTALSALQDFVVGPASACACEWKGSDAVREAAVLRHC